MSDEILQQFEAVKDDKAKTRELSLKLSKDLIDTVHEYFNGLYIITPFQNVEDSLELAAYSKSITAHKGGNIMTTIKTSNLGFPRLGRKENGKSHRKLLGKEDF